MLLKGPKKCGLLRQLGLLTQVNYSEKCVIGGLKGQSLNTSGLKDRFDYYLWPHHGKRPALIARGRFKNTTKSYSQT